MIKSSLPIFPKVGYHIEFVKDYTPPYGNSFLKGSIAEVVSTKVDAINYILYLGFSSGSILRFDYTINKEYIKLLPKTKIGEILYGDSDTC